MLYCGEERKVCCPVCGTEVKNAICFDSTSVSDLFSGTCSHCAYNLEIEHGDNWQSVKPFVISSEYQLIPASSQKAIFDLIATNENKLYSDSFETIYKGFNTFTNKYDLFKFDKLNKQMYVHENNKGE